MQLSKGTTLFSNSLLFVVVMDLPLISMDGVMLFFMWQALLLITITHHNVYFLLQTLRSLFHSLGEILQ